MFKMYATKKDIGLIVSIGILFIIFHIVGWWLIGEVIVSIGLGVIIMCTFLLLLEIYRRIDKFNQKMSLVSGKNRKMLYKNYNMLLNHYKQLEALFALFFTWKSDMPLPKKITEVIRKEQPDLVAEASIGIPVGRRYSLTRFSMYNSLEEFITTHRFKGKALFISEGNEHSIRNMFLDGSEFFSTGYPEVDVMDLSTLKDESYDFVVTDQILEHVVNPWTAVKEMRKKLKPGGIIINTSCSFNPYHTEHDCFRFTVDGFQYIHEAFFDKILLLDYWGNREAIAAFVKDNYSSFDVRISAKALELATRKEREWPWMVWCIARKAA